ncbi:MAG: hypothetical protein WBL05_04390 [Brooklawnia sp.]|uniref:hypothetical protein n=1 Tax=Brooklawnia sp. TaxID=2699740 RepID=UPI003C77A24A
MNRRPGIGTLLWGIAFIVVAVVVILRTEGVVISLPNSGVVLSLTVIAIGVVALAVTQRAERTRPPETGS